VEIWFRWWDEPYAAGSSTLHICSGMNTKPIRQVRIMSIVFLPKYPLPPPTKGRLAEQKFEPRSCSMMVIQAEILLPAL
jgi:hypothetical protein